jgi:hypothetical protein
MVYSETLVKAQELTVRRFQDHVSFFRQRLTLQTVLEVGSKS